MFLYSLAKPLSFPCKAATFPVQSRYLSLAKPLSFPCKAAIFPLQSRYPSLAKPLSFPCKAATFPSQSRAYFSVFGRVKNSAARVGSLRRRLLSLGARLSLLMMARAWLSVGMMSALMVSAVAV